MTFISKDNSKVEEILDELLYNLTTKKPNVVAKATQSLTLLLQEARKQGYEAGEAVGIETGKTIQLAEPSSPPELTNKGKDNHE